MVSYEKEGLDMVFKLVGYSDGYITVGLSPDNDQMGEDLTTACYLNQGTYVLIFLTTFYQMWPLFQFNQIWPHIHHN